MNFYTLPDKHIEQLLGSRIKALRLQKNISQQTLSEQTTLSLNTIKALESGRGKLSSIIAILRELNALDQLDNFILEITISPLQLAKNQGVTRQRARAKKVPKTSKGEVSW